MTAPVESGVVRMEARHAAAAAAFLAQVWDPAATAESLLRARESAAEINTVSPGEPPPTFLFLRGGQVIGYVTTLPIRLVHEGRTRRAHWLNGLMVLPEFRNGPIGYVLLKEAVQHLPLAMALSVAAPARRLFEGLGFTDAGTLPNFIRVVNPRSFLEKLDLTALGISAVPQVAVRAFEAARRANLTGLMADSFSLVDRAYVAVRRDRRLRLARTISDAIGEVNTVKLWDDMRARLKLTPERDLHAWAYRYGHRRGGERTYFTVRVDDPGSGELRAVGVLRRPRASTDPRLNGIRVATLADAMWVPGDDEALLALLGVTDTAARELGGDAVLCTASLPALTNRLPQAGYVPIGGNLHLLVRDVTADPGGPIPAQSTLWHLMRGDAHADDVF